MISDRQLVRAAEQRRQAQQASQDMNDRFALLVVQARREGRTVRELAGLLGMGSSTIHDWTKRGQQLLDEQEK